ncbi:zinc finger C2HC domain-containing protein 1C-like [Uloborus diversus]|uniref:zinc finger C2HC domain-containing protein 1C-like n=1 Tax=Uloborus diversus TaxID=327109 RepID=UPI0024095A45|nr:zinc finger C2HC domain-containing protein 1C-like [Uloborus diversus]
MPSKLEQLQQQYRRQLLQEKEERMIKIHTDNQQKALSKVAKYNGSIQPSAGLIKAPSGISAPQPHHSPIKKGSPGVDRSRPLPPISKEQKNSLQSGANSYQSETDSNPLKAESGVNSYQLGANSSQQGAVYNKSGINTYQPGVHSNQQGAKFGANSYQLGADSNRLGVSSYKSGAHSYQPGANSNQQGANNFHQGSTSYQSSNGSIQYSFQSTRSSPVSAPIENVTRSVSVNSRSKSVDLDARQSPSRTGAANGRAPVRNGFHKPAQSETKQSIQTVAEPVKKPDSDFLQKLKQAELQRLKTNSKVREETPSRNGLSHGAVSKSSTIQKKPTNNRPAPSVSSSTPKPKPTTQLHAPSPARKASPGGRAPAGTAPAKGAEGRKPPGPGQEQCRVCGRNFNADRIEKHRSICQKAAQKKVKVFDATKMRVKGTEAEQFVKKGLPKSEPKAKKSDWRKKHTDFIEAIRQAKMVQQHLAKGGKISELPPPPPSDTSDYVPCPHCGRKFNEGVAQRHIPKCKNILSNKKNPAVARRK